MRIEAWRKRFGGLALALGLCQAAWPQAATEDQAYVMTVLGKVPAANLGKALSHEHLLVDFEGVAGASQENRYDPNEVYDLVLPYLQEARALGYSSFFECTPAYMGRAPELFRRLSQATGLHIVTNTGYYGSAGDKAIPQHAYDESIEEISGRWIAEWEQGIGGTGIRPGFIKTAFDRGEVSAIDLKLFKAAVRAHRFTGLTIGTHTGKNLEAARGQLQALAAAGVSPSAWIWIHAQNADRFADLRFALQAGAWISFDGVRETRAGKPSNAVQKHASLILQAKQEGYLGQILISHDAGWYRIGEPGGSPDQFRGYDAISRLLVPALREGGMTDAELQRIQNANPQEAFSVRVRLAD